ncbi:protein kinase [Amycolatopsis thermalba]|uniref:non-specific serine/threonine protein kinase n=2 Tax=Amycolatopsis TaxID=1813 RepID=A0ABY4P5Q1_9PSEU|nr:protein kinase [Amycolatopsis thermalba]UQS27488.1 protein kinase [Amycolatopsis thermalba]
MTGDVSGDLTGRRLGNYRIDGVLGKGGMSVMYKATDVRLGRKVALKVIGEHLGADAEFRERFVDEARNTSAVDHANVVPLYDFGELDGMLYIAMRLVDGADLASLIADGPISPDRTLRLLDQVADALDCLHERGLVHLDVKPANVLVTSRESAREHVYVADFGLTRRGATGHRTRGGDFLGSPTYAAPEHLRGEPLDGRTDQYALACVLYACLTGQPPFSGDVPTVIKGHLAVEPPAVSGVVGLPSAVDEVVRKGMAKNPADRYDNCVELITAARKSLGPAAGSTTPPGPPQPTTREAGMQPYSAGQPGGHPGAGGITPGAQPGAGYSGPQGASQPGEPGPGGQPDAAQGGYRGPQGTGQPGNFGPPGVPGPGGQPDAAHGGYPGQPGSGDQPGQPGNFGPPAHGGQPGQPGQPGNFGQPSSGGHPGQGSHPGHQDQPGQGSHPAHPGAPGHGAQPGPYGPPHQQAAPGPSPYGHPGVQSHPGMPQFPPHTPPQGQPWHQPPGWPPQQQPYGYAQQPAKKGRGLKWLWASLAGLVVVAAVVVTLVLVNRDGGSAPAPTTAPNIPVGPTGGATGQSTANNPPPATISIKPSP